MEKKNRIIPLMVYGGKTAKVINAVKVCKEK